MSLTKHIIDLGRPLAYYPNLKKITESTAATIFLCQLIYWTDKTKDDGWIWKNSFELDDETGLTYNEQRSARKLLVKKGLIEEAFVRSKYTTKFRVNEDKLNELWEEASKPGTEKKYENKKMKYRIKEGDEGELEYNETEEDTLEITPGEKVPGTAPGEKTAKILAMKELIRNKVHINPAGRKWDSFLEFAYVREVIAGEELGKFLKWALANGFDARYWTPDKMITFYPQAFVTAEEKARENEDDDFIDLIPQINRDEKSVPMPKDLRISSDW